MVWGDGGSPSWYYSYIPQVITEARASQMRFKSRRAEGSVVSLSPFDALAEGGVKEIRTVRAPGEGECVMHLINYSTFYTVTLSATFSGDTVAAPSTNSSDGNSDILDCVAKPPTVGIHGLCARTTAIDYLQLITYTDLISLLY